MKSKFENYRQVDTIPVNELDDIKISLGSVASFYIISSRDDCPNLRLYSNNHDSDLYLSKLEKNLNHNVQIMKIGVYSVSNYFNKSDTNNKSFSTSHDNKERNYLLIVPEVENLKQCRLEVSGLVTDINIGDNKAGVEFRSLNIESQNGDVYIKNSRFDGLFDVISNKGKININKVEFRDGMVESVKGEIELRNSDIYKHLILKSRFGKIISDNNRGNISIKTMHGLFAKSIIAFKNLSRKK